MLNTKVDTLLAVADLLNYTKAAQALSLTQPAVSQHIHQLESDYGVTIFRRGEKPLALTKEGEILVQYARKFKNLHDRMLEQIEDERRRRSQISIGMTTTSLSSNLVDLLANFEKQTDCEKVQIRTSDAQTLFDMLRNYNLDLAIMEGSVPETDFYCLPIDSDQLFAVVSPLNPLAHRSAVTLEELKHQKLILRGKPSGTRTLWENQLRSLFEAIDSFNVIMELDSNEAIKLLVQKNLGVSILSERSCRGEVEAEQLVLLPIENKRMMREVNLVCLKDSEQIASAKILKKMYDAQMRQHAAKSRRNSP
ncbi:MAG: LysR family transcriptional regulator [Pseudoflavonifractor sp.]